LVEEYLTGIKCGTRVIDHKRVHSLAAVEKVIVFRQGGSPDYLRVGVRVVVTVPFENSLVGEMLVVPTI